jgi:hypothetical protein
MRFMMIVKSNAETEAGAMPTPEEFAEMGKFNDELTKAGVLLAADGLHSSDKGFRVSYGPSGAQGVTDGPFTEAKELVAGFWIIQVSSKAEAVEWAKRVPFREGELEVRLVAEEADFQ